MERLGGQGRHTRPRPELPCGARARHDAQDDIQRGRPQSIGECADTGERGRGLSEGQAQRIAIARAILRDAPILLMDEATSALDVATERQVLRSILEHCPDKTCIVTTHRPSVLSMCSRVYRVLDTRVTELSEEESARMVMDF